MPNMLAHLGVQVLGTRLLVPRADLKWAALGCVVPDVAWIVHRFARELPLPFSTYDLRLYAIVQSSLLCCLILATGLALLSRRPAAALALLCANAVIHLLLDATQTKWANGVHLLAPWSWELWNLGLYWPESWITLGMSALGLVGGLWLIASRQYELPGARGRPRSTQICMSIVLLGGYFLLPTMLMDGPHESDNHSIATLRDYDERVGATVEFDRVPLSVGEGPASITTMAGERLALTGVHGATPGLVSIKGVFTTADTVAVKSLHAHYPRLRDLASYLGLAIIALIWAAPHWRVLTRALGRRR